MSARTRRACSSPTSQDDRVTPVIEEREHLWLGAEIARTGSAEPGTLRELAPCLRGVREDRAQVRHRASHDHRHRPGAAGQKRGRSCCACCRTPRGSGCAFSRPGRKAGTPTRGAVSAARGELPASVGVVDVGGGSTEIAVGKPGTDALWVRSIDLGSVRLTSAELPSDPPGRQRAQARPGARASRAGPFRATAGRARARGRGKRAGGREGRRPGLRRRRCRRGDPDPLPGAPCRAAAREFGMHPVRAASVIGGAILLAETSRLLDRPLEVARGGVREGAALALAAAEVAAAA